MRLTITDKHETRFKTEWRLGTRTNPDAAMIVQRGDGPFCAWRQAGGGTYEFPTFMDAVRGLDVLLKDPSARPEPEGAIIAGQRGSFTRTII